MTRLQVMLTIAPLVTCAVMLASPWSTRAAGPATFTCRKYGYTMQIPDQWHLGTKDCTKPVTRLLQTCDGSAVIGVQIVNPNGGFGTSFSGQVAIELKQIGVPASAVAYSTQTLGSTQYEIAIFPPHAGGTGPALSGYIAGTSHDGVEYAFEGFIYPTLQSDIDLLLGQIRAVYAGLRFFDGTAPIFIRPAPTIVARTSPAPSVATTSGGGSSTLSSLAGVAILAACGVLVVGIAVFALARDKPAAG